MNKQTVAKAFKGIPKILKRRSPEILTGIGITGMIVTTITAVKATPKALQLVDEREIKEGKNVFMRSLNEITDDAVDTVLELIAQKSLYKGEEWQHALDEFKKYKGMYAATPDELKNNFAWEQSMNAGMSVGRIRNHSMGTLLVNISQGMELDEAVRKYEAIVAPENYKRPKAIYTKRMLEEAKKTISDLGYLQSLGRRFATLDDITVNNILFANRNAAQRIQTGTDIFSEMEHEISIDPKKFSRVQELRLRTSSRAFSRPPLRWKPCWRTVMQPTWFP